MKKYISILLTLTILFSLSSEAFAIDTSKVDVTLEGVGNYLYETVKEPAVSKAFEQKDRYSPCTNGLCNRHCRRQSVVNHTFSSYELYDGIFEGF